MLLQVCKTEKCRNKSEFMMSDSGSDEDITAEDGGSIESVRKVTLDALPEFWLREHYLICHVFIY